MASIQLRTLIDNVLQDTSRDMVEQCDVVDTAFAKRVEELEDAKAKMEENLKKVIITEYGCITGSIKFVSCEAVFLLSMRRAVW